MIQSWKEMSYQATKRHRRNKCILLDERSQSEKSTYYMIATVWPSGKGKTVDTGKESVAARVRRRQGGTGTGDFQHSKTPLCDAVTMNAGRCMFVQPHRKHTAKSNPNVNDGLWVTMMSQCRSINCFKKKKYHSGGECQ